LIGKEIVSKNIDKEMAKSLKIGQIINLQTDTMELY
jgi:hypothetical protein